MSLTAGSGPTYTDLFCGAGGSSIGLTEAGLQLVVAANHWQTAIDTHSANFPWAEHLCEDIDRYDMRRLPRTDVLWASPICTEVSPAGRRARRPKGQLDLFEQGGHVAQEGFERTRATFHDVIRATEVHRYKAVIVENVVDVADWELFDWWLSGMTLLGYEVQFVSVSSAHVGGDGNGYAPQWRDRLYMVFTRRGVPLPDVAPRPLAWCSACETVVAGFQAWKKPGARRIGKYGRQYVYCCPSRACGHAVAEPFVLPAAAAIDWSDPGTRIGDRKRPLAANTLRRIRAGLEMFGQPVTVAVGGNTWERPGSGYVRAWPVSGPLNARTGTPAEALATAGGSNHGLVLPVGGANHDQPPAGTGEPMRTRVTRDTDALVTPPFVIKNYGGYCTPEQNAAPVSAPLSTVTTSDGHALVVPYRGRRSRATTTGEPLHTMATRDSAALVQPDDAEVMECRLRMLKPREHLRAQRFPDSYMVRGNQGEQTCQAGNAVSANVAHWLGRSVAEVL